MVPTGHGSAVSGVLVESREIDLVGFPYGGIFFLNTGLFSGRCGVLQRRHEVGRSLAKKIAAQPSDSM
jgi:hypothetical protein